MDASGSSDLPTKYQKLATEYSKMRAQVSVLRKAVLEEQSKVVDLKETLKEREQILRKNEQEMESLNFRNQQLTRRVTVLQEELESLHQKHRGKNKQKSIVETHGQQAPLTNSILGEELQQKIEENARLHQKLQETELEHQTIVQKMQTHLDELEKEVKGHNHAVDEINQTNHVLIDKLQQDKARLEVRLQTVEKELRETNFKAEVCQEQLNCVQKDLGSKLESSTQIIKSHLPFLDTKIPKLNSLNVPACSRRLQEKSRHLVGNVAELIHDIVSGLSNFHTYSEQRVLLSPVEESTNNVSSVNKQLARYLHENATCLRQLEQAFHDFHSGLKTDVVLALDMTNSFEEFLLKLRTYVLYLKKLLPYHLLSLEEESGLPSCPPCLRIRNQALMSSWQQIMAAFEKLETYVKLLTVGSKPARQRAVKHIVIGVSDLHSAVKDMCTHHNSKLALEKELPTSSEKLKTTDECILTSLVSLVAVFGKLSNLLSENLESILTEQLNAPVSSCDTTRFEPKIIATYKQRAASYISSLDEECPESVPYAESLKNRHILQNSTESRENLASQLNSLQEKITKLEQSKEHWMLEYQLLHMKHVKLKKKTQELDAQTSSTSGSEGSPTKLVGSGESISHAVMTPTTITTLLGKLEVEDLLSEDLGNGSSETLRLYFVGRINELVVQRQLADSKAVTFHAELCAVQKRLIFAEKAKATIQEQLRKANEAIANLKEELHTTTNNYKVQLSTMSEHLANMNEKLTAQKDEIDDLKFALNNLGNKKSKGK